MFHIAGTRRVLTYRCAARDAVKSEIHGQRHLSKLVSARRYTDTVESVRCAEVNRRLDLRRPGILRRVE